MLFTSEQADQRARKVLFTSVVYTNTNDNDRKVIIILIILSVMIIEIMINPYMQISLKCLSACDNFEKEKIPIDEEARTLMEK